jgi:hypothetical protein
VREEATRPDRRVGGTNTAVALGMPSVVDQFVNFGEPWAGAARSEPPHEERLGA